MRQYSTRAAHEFSTYLGTGNNVLKLEIKYDKSAIKVVNLALSWTAQRNLEKGTLFLGPSSSVSRASCTTSGLILRLSKANVNLTRRDLLSAVEQRSHTRVFLLILFECLSGSGECLACVTRTRVKFRWASSEPVGRGCLLTLRSGFVAFGHCLGVL